MKANPVAKSASDARDAAAGRLIAVYTALAQREEHLLSSLLNGEAPRQWTHYPEGDAIDAANGYQWFYHAHPPEDRPDAAEHGHVHLFARRKRWCRRVRSAREVEFARLEGGAASAETRHLLAIGFDAKGVPISLFTVNSWVTGDRMLSAATTADVLARMTLDTGHPKLDAVIESLMKLYRPEIRALLVERDGALGRFAGANVLADESLEVLSERAIDLDATLWELSSRSRSGASPSPAPAPDAAPSARSSAGSVRGS